MGPMALSIIFQISPHPTQVSMDSINPMGPTPSINPGRTRLSPRRLKGPGTIALRPPRAWCVVKQGLLAGVRGKAAGQPTWTVRDVDSS